MIHWTTPRTARPHQSSHVAVDVHAAPRRSRRGLFMVLMALPLLMALVAVLNAQTPAPARPVADSAARPVRRSWTSDRRDFAVGDIIVVLIDEATVASANKGNVASDTKRRTMEAGADLPMAAPMLGKNPKISVGSSNNGESRQRGEATRGNRFVGEMSVRVVAVTKEGNLQIKGAKTVDVDKNMQSLTLTGFIRAEDVNTRDQILSSHIADVELAYVAKGNLGKPKTGLLTKILGVFWP